jgi:hypothetical protein
LNVDGGRIVGQEGINVMSERMGRSLIHSANLLKDTCVVRAILDKIVVGFGMRNLLGKFTSVDAIRKVKLGSY